MTRMGKVGRVTLAVGADARSPHSPFMLGINAAHDPKILDSTLARRRSFVELIASNPGSDSLESCQGAYSNNESARDRLSL